MQTPLAWLLQRSPTILLIPGTPSVTHLCANVAALDVTRPPDAVAQLNAIG
jgi:pyridoxine 4-dehydrogenase